MEPGAAVQFRIHKDSTIIPILNRINPNPHIDTYFSKMHSNIVLLCPPNGVSVKTFKALLPSVPPILATCAAHLNLLDLITLTILGERYKL